MLTEIACIIDRSGSMEDIKDSAISGFNAFVEEQKKQEGEATLTLVLFNHEYQLVYSGRALGDVPELTNETFKPDGTTALLDAVGRTIFDVKERLSKTKAEMRPSKVIVLILTDGLENASKDYTKAKVAEMVETQEKEHCWEFIFLGANMDAIQVATSLSIPRANAVRWEGSGEGAFGAMACKAAMMVSKKRSEES